MNFLNGVSFGSPEILSIIFVFLDKNGLSIIGNRVNKCTTKNLGLLIFMLNNRGKKFEKKINKNENRL